MVDWTWNEQLDESGVAHQSTTNTDHDDATLLKQGYDYANFSEVKPTPTAFFPLHEDSGTTAYDLSGNANNGVYNFQTLGNTGLLGTTCPEFDGVDDRVDVINAFSNQSNVSEYTLLAWVRLKKIEVKNVSPIEIQSGNFTQLQSIRLQSSGDVQTYFRTGTDGVTRFSTSTEPINLTTWHMVAVTITSGDQTIYVDGEQQASDSQTYTGTFDAMETAWIGSTQDPRYLNGKITNVGYWTTALTSAQIQTLYDVVDIPGEWLSSGQLL